MIRMELKKRADSANTASQRCDGRCLFTQVTLFPYMVAKHEGIFSFSKKYYLFPRGFSIIVPKLLDTGFETF